MRKEILVLTSLILSMFALSGFAMAAPTATSTASVSVPGYLSISVDKPTFSFADTNPGVTSPPVTLTVTVYGETNVNVNVTTRATDFSFVSGNFPASQMTWNGVSYTNSNVEVAGLGANPGVDQFVTMDHRVTIPKGQTQGTYTSTITITGIAV